MKKFSIDRFEDGIAVLIDENKEKINVSRCILPEQAAEGDVLSFDGEKYVMDSAATADKKAEVKSLIDELFQ